MNRPDPWGYAVGGFMVGVVLTAFIGGKAVPRVHAGVQRAVAETTAPETTTPEKPSVSHWLRRCTHAVEGLSEDLEGVQVPRYSEVGP